MVGVATRPGVGFSFVSPRSQEVPVVSLAEKMFPVTATSWVVPLPQYIRGGDVLFAFIASDRNTTTTATPPAGWAVVPGTVAGLMNRPALDEIGWLFYKSVQAGAAELTAASVTFTMGSASGGSAYIVRYADAHPTSPINTASSNAPASATSHPLATVTPSVNGCRLVGFVFADTSASLTPGAFWTPPAGWTERVDRMERVLFTQNTIADFVQSTAAAISPTFTSGSAQPAVTFLVALNPRNAVVALDQSSRPSGPVHPGLAPIGRRFVRETYADRTPAAATGDASVSGADNGAGSDSATLAAAVTTGDAGSGADSAALTVSATVTDAGSGADTATTTTATSGTDTGSGADTSSLVVNITATDTAVGVDSATVDTGSVPISGTDTGTGASSASVVVNITASDAATAVDTATTATTVTATESGAGAGTATLTAAFAPADTGVGTDTAATTVGASVTDAATGASSAALAANIAAVDTTAGVDNATVATGGALTPADSDHTYILAPESRALALPVEDRTYALAGEDRQYVLAVEDRQYLLPPDDRALVLEVT